MTKNEVAALVQREIDGFRYEVPADSLGTPLARHEIERQLQQLKEALVEPSLEALEIQPPDSPDQAKLWLVAVDGAGGFKVFYDPEHNDFCLAAFGQGGSPHSIGVRGDLVGTFMAR